MGDIFPGLEDTYGIHLADDTVILVGGKDQRQTRIMHVHKKPHHFFAG